MIHEEPPAARQPWEDVPARVRSAPSSWGECETCGAHTHNQKPRCPKHVLELPYVQEVLREIKPRRRTTR